MNMRQWMYIGLLAGAIGTPLSGLADSGENIAHEYKPNMVGGFIGMTGAGRRENGLTLGLVYERRITAHFGTGAVVERVSGDLDFWIYTVPFAYHTGAWKLFVSPGIEVADAGGSEFMVRFGGEYGFEFGDWEISPGVDLDFVDGDMEVVVGVLIAYDF
jgi:hypothetical protein